MSKSRSSASFYGRHRFALASDSRSRFTCNTEAIAPFPGNRAQSATIRNVDGWQRLHLRRTCIACDCNAQCERASRTRFPRASPLGHCIFQSRVLGLALFFGRCIRTDGSVVKNRTAPIRATRRHHLPTRPFSLRDSRVSSGHCQPRSADRYRFLSGCFLPPHGKSPVNSAN